MAQTAVEWLAEQLKKQGFLYDLDIQAAKQMEKEQLHKCASFWRGKECEIEKQIFDQYYTQTYGNNQNK